MIWALYLTENRILEGIENRLSFLTRGFHLSRGTLAAALHKIFLPLTPMATPLLE